jgi:hypothetical protein
VVSEQGNRLSWSGRREIQFALGGLGEVLPYRQQSDRAAGMPSIGWYAELYFELERCNCPRCLATRAGAPAFIAGRRIEAIEEVGAYKHQHPELVQRAGSSGAAA